METILMSVLGSFFAACLGSYLAFYRFKKAQDWTERREAYRKVIEACEELIFWAEQRRDQFTGKYTIEHENYLYPSIRIIKKYSAVGRLIFSVSFHKEIEFVDGLLNKSLAKASHGMMEIRNGNDWQDFCESLSSDIIKFLPSRMKHMVGLAYMERA